MIIPRLWRKSTLRTAIIIGIFFVMLYFVVLIRIPYFEVLKLKVRDCFCELTYKKRVPSTQIENIVILSIDDESNRVLKKRWPWSRAIYAQVIDKLGQYHPKVIGMDIAFLGSQDPYIDLVFSNSLKKAGNVLLATFISSSGYFMQPYEIFSKSALGTGIVNTPRDRDFYTRRARLISLSRAGELIDWSFALKVTCVYLDIPFKNIKRINSNKISGFSKKKEIQIPTERDGTLFINYIGGKERFNIIPIWKILKEDFSQSAFKDKIVLIGAFSEAFHDISHTPLGLMPGVVVLANQVLMLIEGNFIKIIPPFSNFLILLILSIITAIFSFRFSILKGAGLLLLEIFILEFIGLWMFLSNYRGDFFAPLLILPTTYLTINFYKYGVLLLEHEYLKKQAITDELTGLYTYRYFQIALKNEFDKLFRYKTNFSLVIFDIDHFKNINDTYGHKTGNIVLQKVSNLMKSSFRKTDILARFGGDEFCIIIASVKKADLLKMVNKLMRVIEESKFPKIKEKVTISIGVILLPHPQIHSSEKLFECADIALYQAKKTGRNRFCVFSPEMFENSDILNK